MRPELRHMRSAIAATASTDIDRKSCNAVDVAIEGRTGPLPAPDRGQIVVKSAAAAQ